MKKRESKFRGTVGANAKKQQRQGSSYGYLNLPKGINVFTAEPGGRATLDFIPYVVSDKYHPDRDTTIGIAMPNELWYKRPFKVHRNIGVEKDAVVCLSSFGKRCPVCEYRSKRIKEGADKEETDVLKPSLRNLYIVVPIGMKKVEEIPMLWDISQYNFQNLLNDELEEQPEHEIFPDLEEGESLKVRFDSKIIGSGNPFAQASRIDFVDRKKQYDESILDEIPCLDDILQELSYAELESKFMEIEIEEEEDEEKISVERNKSTRSRKTVIPQDEDEEDEEDEEDVEDEEEEEEEEEEEKPKSVYRRTSKSEIEKSSKGKNRCPSGYRFGKDYEKYPECDDCDVWEDCMDAK